MSFNLETLGEIQFTISERMNQRLCFLTSHAAPPVVTMPIRIASSEYNLFRPRASRDITVPIGKSAMAAISLSLYGHGRCVAGNNRWSSAHFRPTDTRHRHSFYYRNVGGNGFDKDPSVPRHVTAAFATRATASWFLGRLA
jgi:hypothetical protein